MIELLHQARAILHDLPGFLSQFGQDHGPLLYLLLFAIIFCETGLIVTPFLPGDSLLFAAGVVVGTGGLNWPLLVVVLVAAAVIGDNVNYWIGAFIGPRVFKWQKSRFFNPAHLQRTHLFYEKYGTKTIILARFVPIVRTFAPFVAGVGRMTYRKFLPFDIVGGSAWVLICTTAGVWLGQKAWIKQHFELVIIIIVFISILPMIIEYLRHRHDARQAAAQP